MSRSRKKNATPKWTTRLSNKSNKRVWNHKLRNTIKKAFVRALRWTGLDSLQIPKLAQVTDWRDSGQDTSGLETDPNEIPKARRK
ncbi:MAG: hypothetical protein K2Y22_14940 [Candidatus Obscuribacterales bacterium]|nr:hypothetical protein [Candidatus Obscuribacterales bacterium]